MKTKRYATRLMVMAGVLATATSCSDFDDYNKVPGDVNTSASLTLWQNISQNSDLSDFAELVKKAGYDRTLDASRCFTVWAPLNGTFDKAALLDKDSAELLTQFVKNHVADYAHVVSGDVDERVKMLNNKSYDFKGDGAYTFDGVSVATPNLPSTNGIMHTLQGMATFYPNIYEYLSAANGIDSLQAYVKHYETTYLDTKNSVVGPTVNGKVTYIDSVMVTENSLFRRLNADLTLEDSSYTMVMPTSKAWTKACERISPYFHYINTTVAKDIANMKSASDNPQVSYSTNAAYLADSLVRRALVSNLVFNNNARVNRWVTDASADVTDSIVTTNGVAIANAKEFLAGAPVQTRMSNGFARVADTLALRSWDAWAPTLTCPAYNTNNIKTFSNGSVTRLTVAFDRPRPDGSKEMSYIWVQPSSNFAKPEMNVNLPNVLSTTYNIYCVMVPPGFSTKDSTAWKPNQLDFILSYCTAAGKLATVKLNQKVENDPTRIDTVKVGQFTFPVAYYGLKKGIVPSLRITTDFSAFDRKKMAKYTRDLHISAILLVPAERDDFEGKK